MPWTATSLALALAVASGVHGACIPPSVATVVEDPTAVALADAAVRRFARDGQLQTPTCADTTRVYAWVQEACVKVRQARRT